MDTSAAGLGALLVVAGGLFHGSFALPMKRITLRDHQATCHDPQLSVS